MIPAHIHLTGTGLTHLGSAEQGRDMMQNKNMNDAAEELTDSMRMFRWGWNGANPRRADGVQPEWFYKGDGTLGRAGGAAPIALLRAGWRRRTGNRRASISSATDGTPLRVGFALGNEYSDHVTES